VRVLVVTGGHPFERDAFLDVFESLAATVPGLEFEHVEQPAALDRVRPGQVDADVVAFYDMPGLRFTGGDPPVEFVEPPDGYIEGLREIVGGGVGMVFLHHSIASWPTSAAFAELIGGRFHYQPAVLRGVAYPDSGYVFDVTHTVEVLDPSHPICAGVDATFDIVDELYCFPVFEADVTPLMRTRHTMTADGFFSADAAIRGRRNDATGWSHPAGSPLVAWTRSVGRGRLAYLQFGDGPATYADPHYRRILANAIAWTATPPTFASGFQHAG
jgi:type 1 glutamine amidotransferase